MASNSAMAHLVTLSNSSFKYCSFILVMNRTSENSLQSVTNRPPRSSFFNASPSFPVQALIPTYARFILEDIAFEYNNILRVRTS